MTEQEARERVARLTAESPERETHSWIAREGSDGEWSVVKLAIPSPKSPQTVNGQAGEPLVKDDPRSSLEQRFPPWGVGI
jgi:hypothetical protein